MVDAFLVLTPPGTDPASLRAVLGPYLAGAEPAIIAIGPMHFGLRENRVWENRDGSRRILPAYRFLAMTHADGCFAPSSLFARRSGLEVCLIVRTVEPERRIRPKLRSRSLPGVMIVESL